MVSPARKARSRQTEETVAQWFRERAWPSAERIPAGLPGTDVTGMPLWDVEVKARRDFNLTGWLKQAAKRAGSRIPFVVMRPDGYGPERIAQWPVVITLENFTELMKVYEFGEPR